MVSIDKFVAFKISPEIDAEVEFMARSKEMSKAGFYRKAIYEYLDKNREEIMKESKKRLEQIEKEGNL